MRLEKYQHVFIEPEDEHAPKAFYKIYHNHHGASPCGAFELIPYGEQPEEDFITIDEESFGIFYDIFAEHIPDFSETDYWNPVKPEIWLQIRTQILRMIDELEHERRTSFTKKMVWKAYLDFKASYHDERWKEFFQKKHILIDFCRAFLWYFDKYRKFTYYDDGKSRIMNFVGW